MTGGEGLRVGIIKVRCIAFQEFATTALGTYIPTSDVRGLHGPHKGLSVPIGQSFQLGLQYYQCLKGDSQDVGTVLF